LPVHPGPADAACFRGPPTVDGIARGVDWNDYWVAADQARRRAAPWPALLDTDITATEASS